MMATADSSACRSGNSRTSQTDSKGMSDMDIQTWVATCAIVIAGLTASYAAAHASRLKRRQWQREELVLRKDVLRRLCGYLYRLTTGRIGQDGEPFVALNEAWIVYADCPKVIEALTMMHRELGEENRLSDNILTVVREMAEITHISVEDLDGFFITNPFVPPITSS